MDIEELILLPENSQLLVMNSWRHEIPTAQRNIIIAEALNRCTVDKEFNVYGYLITNVRVFLIGRSEATSFQEILDYFYRNVALGIIKYKKGNDAITDKILSEPEVYENLFTAYPFYNTAIQRVITGHKVELPYYDADLKRLQDYIRHHNYCSVLDYNGGQSPVIVNTSSIL